MVTSRDVGDAAQGAADAARDGAGRAQQSQAVQLIARLGLLAYGVVHLLIGWLAIQLAVGSGSGAADSQGALRELVNTPLGTPLLWLLSLGFAALVVWQLAEAVDPDGKQEGTARQVARALAIAKALLFAVLAVSSLRFALGDRSSGGGATEESLTGELLAQPAGQWLVGFAGLVIAGVGAALIWRGWSEGFREHLDRSSGGHSGRALVQLGKVGYVAKGAALIVLGGLVVIAAWRHDADASGGLDDALRTLLQQPLGAVIVGAIGAGFAAYGVFCFARARDLRPGKS